MKWENSRMGEEPHPEKMDEGIGQPYTGFPKSPILTCWRKNVSKPCFSAASYKQKLHGTGFPSSSVIIVKREHLFECRKNAPVLVDGRTKWPVTIDQEWCGEFELSGKWDGMVNDYSDYALCRACK